LVPALIFFVCLCAGVWAGTRWLPPLADGPVGGLAFFAVCGLLGAGLGLVGLHIYGIVRTLEETGRGLLDSDKGDVLASGLAQMLYDAGVVFGVALIVYLLAPSGQAREVGPGA
jgi:hypothetical protein